jgi:hypothetical protein
MFVELEEKSKQFGDSVVGGGCPILSDYYILVCMGFSSSAWVVDAVMGTLNAGILLSILLMFVGILSLWQA